MELGNALIAMQPPRGYGMDPDAIYHTPDLPPTHHYAAFYRWLAVVHARANALPIFPRPAIPTRSDVMPIIIRAVLGSVSEGSQIPSLGVAWCNRRRAGFE